MRMALNLLVELNIVLIVLGCILSKNEQLMPYER